jgi:NADH:ubiquinone oxidoreductase subunit F (NADH-binding)
MSATVAAPVGPTRLLAGLTGSGTVDLEAHLAQWGPLPDATPGALLDAVEASGLRGHGGAWFPVGVKWRSVQRTGLRTPVVVANGAEGEPASGKDRLLIAQVPHLVLDGLAVAARATGAGQAYVHVPAAAVPLVRQALEERAALRLDPCPVEVVVAPDRFVAGQETAVVATIAGRSPGLPTFQGLTPIRVKGVGGRPTLVQNVETLAHAALVARFGPEWFRSVGTATSPGTVLTTVTGRWDGARIVEVPLGTTLGAALGLDPVASGLQGVLLGGYGGGWLRPEVALAMPFTEEEARARGSSIGAGVVVLLPTGPCPLAEVARVARYMEGQGAGQCGPCVNGLDTLATALERLAWRPQSLRGGAAAIGGLCDLVEGRGACRHPDGVARFVRTALDVYSDHVSLHASRGPCPPSAPLLPVPAEPARAGSGGAR